jgi:hypothetical protein
VTGGERQGRLWADADSTRIAQVVGNLVRRAIEAGFDGHVAKPCDPEKIERLLG